MTCFARQPSCPRRLKKALFLASQRTLESEANNAKTAFSYFPGTILPPREKGLLLPEVVKVKIRRNFLISFYTMAKNEYHVKEVSFKL